MISYIIPTAILLIILCGVYKKDDAYSLFVTGAKDGIKTAADILPSIIGIMMAVSMLRASGAIDLLANAIAPALRFIGMPAEVIPLVLLRPISGGGALGIASDIIKTSGPDSYAGRLASVMMGSTETTFFTVALYYGAAKIKNIRHTLKAALAADIAGFIFSIIVCRLYF